MKNILFGLTLAVSLMIVSYAMAAHEGHEDGNEQNSMMMKNDADSPQAGSKTAAVEVGNKHCPVSGDEIPAPGQKGSMGEAVKYEYNGKIYNLCCTMCVKDFKKNPEKYSKIADDEAAKEKMMQQGNQ